MKRPFDEDEDPGLDDMDEGFNFDDDDGFDDDDEFDDDDDDDDDLEDDIDPFGSLSEQEDE